MSLTQLCEQLRDIGPGARKDQFEADADKYLRMLNTLSRLSKSFLALQKFQRDSAGAAAVELKRLDLNRKISQVEEMAMQDRSDDFFGWKSADRIKRDLANEVRTDSTPSLITAPKSDEGASSSSSSSSSSSFPAPSPAAPNQNDLGSRLKPHGLKEGSRGSQSAETPGNVPVTPPHPEGMPESPDRAPSPARSTPSLQDTANGNGQSHTQSGFQSKTDNQNSEIQRKGDRSRPLSTSVFPLACGFCPNGPATLGTDFKHCCKDAASELSRPASSSALAPKVPGHPGTVEECHYCRQELPPLLPNGQRPFTHCEKCGTALRPPETRHLYCPTCHGRLHNIFDGDRRTSDHCPHCAATLPPVPPPPEPTPATDESPRLAA